MPALAFSVGLGPATTTDITTNTPVLCGLRKSFALASGVLVDAVKVASIKEYPASSVTSFSPEDSINSLCNTLSGQALLTSLYGDLAASTPSPTPSASATPGGYAGAGSSALSAYGMRMLRAGADGSSSSSAQHPLLSPRRLDSSVALAKPATDAPASGTGSSLSLGFNVLVKNVSSAAALQSMLQTTSLSTLAAGNPALASQLSSALGALATARGDNGTYSLSVDAASVQVVTLTMTRSVWGMLYDFLMRNVSGVVTGGVLMLLFFLLLACGPKDMGKMAKRGLAGTLATVADLMLVAEGKKELRQVAREAWEALRSGRVFMPGPGREEKMAAAMQVLWRGLKRHAVRARARRWFRTLVKEYHAGSGTALHRWARGRGMGPDYWQPPEDAQPAKLSAAWSSTATDMHDLVRATKGEAPAGQGAAGEGEGRDAGAGSPLHIPSPPRGPAPQRQGGALSPSSLLLLNPIGSLKGILQRSEALRGAAASARAGAMGALARIKAAASGAANGIATGMTQAGVQVRAQAGGAAAALSAAAGGAASAIAAATAAAAAARPGPGVSARYTGIVSEPSSEAEGGVAGGEEGEEVVIVHPRARTQPVIRTDGKSIIPESHVIRREKRVGPRVPPPPKILTKKQREAQEIYLRGLGSASAGAAVPAPSSGSVSARSSVTGAVEGRGFRSGAGAGAKVDLGE